MNRWIGVLVWGCWTVLCPAAPGQNDGAALHAIRQRQQDAERRYDEAYQAWRQYDPGRDSPELGSIRAQQEALRDQIQSANVDFQQQLTDLQLQRNEAAHEDTPQDDDDSGDLRAQLEELLSQKQRVMQEFRSGSFCSECMRSATEIRAEEGEEFGEHLRRVDGHPVPATADQLRQKEQEFDDKVARLEERIQSMEERKRERQRQRTERLNELQQRESQVRREHSQLITDLNRQVFDLNAQANQLQAGGDSTSQSLWQAVQAAQQEVVDANVAYLERDGPIGSPDDRGGSVIDDQPGGASDSDHPPRDVPELVGGPLLAAPPPFAGRTETPLLGGAPSASGGAATAWEGLTPASTEPSLVFAAGAGGAERGGERSWGDAFRDTAHAVGETLQEAKTRAVDAARKAVAGYFSETIEEVGAPIDPEKSVRDMLGRVRSGESLTGAASGSIVDMVEGRAERLQDRLTNPAGVVAEHVQEAVTEAIVQRVKSYAYSTYVGFVERLRGRSFTPSERLDFDFSYDASKLVAPRQWVQDFAGRWVLRPIGRATLNSESIDDYYRPAEGEE